MHSFSASSLRSLCRGLPVGLGLIAAAACVPAFAAYVQTNLVSDIPGFAAQTDPNLRNPWGMSSSPTSPIWVSDNGTGVSTLYNTAGVPQALVVTIPPPAGANPPSTPTGQVFNGTGDFAVGSGVPARFIFATEDGTISGWHPSLGTAAQLRTDNSASGAVYKGLAMGSAGGSNFLYAANFHAAGIDVFDSGFAPVTLAGHFIDPAMPAGYAPFNIRNLGGLLYVTYALRDASGHDDVAGAGNGFVDVFDTSGNLIRRVASHGTLNSPWGLALAPAGFGEFSDDLLVGNFGDGRINAFDPITDGFLGQLTDTAGSPITIDGLWGLLVGNGGNGGNPDALYFTAGIAGEEHGLFGSLAAVPEPDTTLLAGLAVLALVTVRKRR